MDTARSSSPVIQRAPSVQPSIQSSNSAPAPPKNPSTSGSSGKRGKGHAFTQEQEIYIAELLSNPETWALLDGSGEKNDQYFPKKSVHENIAKSVNEKFSTKEAPLNLDGSQIKNKIEVMKRLWKTTYGYITKSGNGNLPGDTLRDRVLEKCCFYYILEEVWSASWTICPREPTQLVQNLERPSNTTYDSGNDASDEANETAVEPDESISVSPQAKQITGKRPRAGGVESTSKKSRYQENSMFLMIEDLNKTSSVENELKRRELDLQEKKIEMENRLIEVQIEKMKADVENERKRVEADISLKAKQLDIEAKQLDIKLLKAQTELRQAEALVVLKSIEDVKLERAKRGASPGSPGSPTRLEVTTIGSPSSTKSNNDE